jgi:hypothetical protein
MKKERATGKSKSLHNWANHLALRLRRTSTGYSIRPKYDKSRDTDYADLRTLNQVERWLHRWSREEIARLSR